MNYKKGLKRNLTLYTVRGMFERRPYLPVITIYATMVSGVTLAQIGIISAITAFVSLVTEIPSGYISDKIGHKKALLFGSFLQVLSPLSYVMWQNFSGACVAMAVFWAGASFHSGTVQAFVHETLRELGRNDDFTIIAARERRYAMMGNLMLVGLVPLTYQISPILPFVIGFFIHACAFVMYALMTVPHKVKQSVQEEIADGFFVLLKTIRTRKEIILFFFLGVVTASYNKLPEFREIYFQELGVPLWAFGFILSLTGVVAIGMTYAAPRIKKINARIFYGIDFMVACVFSIFVGIISYPIFAVILFVGVAAYRRTRSIVIHAHLLDDCPTKNLKATYLSMYAFFSALCGIFIPLILGGMVGYLGVQKGYLAFGLILFLLLLPFYFLVYKNLGKR